jgi:outer membrane protein
MKEKVLFGIIGVFTIVTILLLFNSFTTSPKVVVVDSQKVLEDYQGFIEAKDSYELKVKNLTQDFNEKRKIFESQSMEFKTGLGKLSEIQKANKQKDLAKMQQELMKLGTTIENQSSTEEAKLLQAVYNKINAFITRFGEQHNYDVILGANGQGNVMYVEGQIDITEDVIRLLNKEYVEGI